MTSMVEPALKKSLILTLVKQKQNFIWVCIILVTVVIYLFTDKNW